MSNPLPVSPADDIFDCSILVVCDNPAALGGYRDSLAERGYAVVCEADASRVAAHLARDRRISVVFLDIGDQALDQLEAPGSPGLKREGVEYVVAAGRQQALKASAVPRTAERLVRPFNRDQMFNAVNTAFNIARLQRFRLEEMRTLESSLLEFKSRTLAAVSQLLARTQAARSGETPEAEDTGRAEAVETPMRAVVEEECRRARLRKRIFGPLALSHSGWMLLLVLAEAQLAGSELTVKGAAYSAGLPLSSALRKINEMCTQDLMKKDGDPHDARRSFVTLTPSGLSYLNRYLAELAREPAQRA